MEETQIAKDAKRQDALPRGKADVKHAKQAI